MSDTNIKLNDVEDVVESTSSDVIENVNDVVVDIDLDLSVTRKKRIRINGDNSKIIELDLSDMTIGNRLDEEYKKLMDYMNTVKELASTTNDDVESLSVDYSQFKEIDNRMRECIDNIFDYPVSEICAPKGSMYDPFNGSFRFEHIIDTLTKLYETNINDEYKKMSKRINSTAAKYTKGRKKR